LVIDLPDLTIEALRRRVCSARLDQRKHGRPLKQREVTSASAAWREVTAPDELPDTGRADAQDGPDLASVEQALKVVAGHAR